MGNNRNAAHGPSHKLRWIIGAVAAAVLIPLVLLANTFWPYRYRTVKPLLENVFASQIKIDHYHRTYFPRPGFVADGITLQRKLSLPGSPPIGTAQHLFVQGGWLDLLLLRQRVELVDVTGLAVTIPPSGSKERAAAFPAGSSADFAGPTTVIEKLAIHDSVLQIDRATPQDPIRFPIHTLIIHNLQRGVAIRYDLDMQNWKPAGHILTHGHFGPLNPKQLGQTPVDGDATFDNVQFTGIDGLHGTLTSTEHYSGVLEQIETTAQEDTPDFAVGTGRPTDISGTVLATVNGLNGDTTLHAIDLKVNRAATAHVTGSVAGAPKIVKLDFASDHGHVQDWLRVFLHDRAPLTGVVTLRGHAVIAAGTPGETFLQRLHLEGSFDAPTERVTDKTQAQSLTSFSQRAQGAKEPDDAEADALSSLGGHVTLANGIVHAQAMHFAVPGATADFSGTYSLQTKKVDMPGTLRMDTDISHVTTGWKSWLLKPLAPLFTHKPTGAVIPIAITGTPGNYKIGQNILHTK